MSARRFNPFNNFFLSSTKGNYTKFQRIAKSMFDACTANEADPFIDGILTEITPTYGIFTNYNNLNKAAAGPQHGAVGAKNLVMSQIHSTDLNNWYVAVQVVAPKGTELFDTVFPHGLSVFHEGTVDDQLAQVLALITNMTGVGSLAAIMAVIQAKYNIAFPAKTKVGVKKTSKKTAAVNAKIAMNNHGVVMFEVYGSFIHEYGSDPITLALYIDVAEIQRKPEDNIITAIIVKHSADKVASRTLLDTDEVTVLNDGTVDLKFYLAHTLTSPKGLFVTVPAGTSMTFSVLLMGSIANRYVMVENDSLTTNGHYTFTFND